ncbi:hypothetical protein BJX66DRAFT_294540 [Aspergillus keveii]|uniref:Uncharacterized protein n=1 Tax=Aspergillus keveii TaxID=714993 RepID=A0ABR4GJC3_9EURO
MSDPIAEDDTATFPTIETTTHTFEGGTTILVYTTWIDAQPTEISTTIASTTGTTEAATTITDPDPTTIEPPQTGTTTTTIIITDTPTPATQTPETSADQTAPITVTIYSPLPTQTDISSGGGGGGGLSSGAKAGIGVGVALGGALLVAVGVIFWLRRQKRRMEDALQEPPVVAPTLRVKGPPYEVEATERQVFELPGKGGAIHRASDNDRYELDT